MKILTKTHFEQNVQRISYLFILFIFPLLSHANINLTGIFSDHMVLQQQSKVAIWG